MGRSIQGLASLTGVIHNHFKKICIKNHSRPAFSLFTYGLDLIREQLFRGVALAWLRIQKGLNFGFLPPPQKILF